MLEALKLLRSTAFRLSLVYLAVFAAFAGLLIAYLSWNTWVIFTQQLDSTIEAEVQGLAEQYRLGGVLRLVQVIDRRTRNPSSSLYLVQDPQGNRIAGNVASVPAATWEAEGLVRIRYTPFEESSGKTYEAVVRVFDLIGGFRLLVGRDVEERRHLQEIVWRATLLAVVLMIVLGVGGGYYVSRRILARIDAVAETSRTIMAGDLSQRVPLSGSGDEFDRLAESLNAMLDRIERLMHGLKEVSDNIAHDLKTPLTRLRGRVEAALRADPSEQGYREALEQTIEESDRLIAIFNALLMIARAEAGAAGVSFAPVDVAAVARDVVELYEPAAEEAGIGLVITGSEPVRVLGNRELIGQAIANLVDNALKHGSAGRAGIATDPDGSGGGCGAVRVSVTIADGKARIAVADSGPGIPEADRSRVVERFARLEASRSAPGAGLGLALVAAVARLHSGELAFSDGNPGLVATLALPLAPAGEAASGQGSPPVRG
ncbi:signal transduction histidine kinase [Tepidamorphus gemmatus]|uniref:histidine kinase n=1 Tax=Tepidamorphus gemmatus TaxID=747076 RepID=A0A4R3M6S5_9HYPH|nr:ATP-binding protein [Tepidamorphus gemmatus]TCT08706.1 signal transduction histidine kinase [Tepidamorphus gemmatus]